VFRGSRTLLIVLVGFSESLLLLLLVLQVRDILIQALEILESKLATLYTAVEEAERPPEEAADDMMGGMDGMNGYGYG
jgi:hypothetical protein